MLDSTRKPTILVVDDSFTNRTLLGKIFSNDFIVEQAENGVVAMEKLKALKEVAVVVLDIEMPEMDGFDVLAAMQEDKRLRNIPVVVDTIVDDIESQLKALDGGASDILIKPFNPIIVLHRVRNLIARREAVREAARAQNLEELLRQSEIDEKTGFYTKRAFCRKASELMKKNPTGSYVILHWDIDNFKVYNDVYGVREGDELLALIGRSIKPYLDENIVYGHWDADHFVVCLTKERFEANRIATQNSKYHFDTGHDFDIIVRIGVYEVEDINMEVELMCDRASLALQSTKGDFHTRVAYYNESMRSALLEEQEIVSEMEQALISEQFVTYFQPQYDYASGKIIGAEALVRWKHPEKGLIPPDKFIPIFERNGFISKLDEYMYEGVCKQLRTWIDAGIKVVPISINVSRKDIYNPHLVKNILAAVKKNNISTYLLRVEITESAYMENAEQLIKTVADLRDNGLAVEMDDFGSGYSSLNTLKSVPVDKLKLDIKFLEKNSDDDTKGGSILSSIVRMANWLRLPVIAEGVEEIQQAEYLKSIGCLHMQGYLFARPMPLEDFEALLKQGGLDEGKKKELANSIQGAADFLSDSTQATLLFNSFVGGACIAEFDGEHLEALRLNDRFFDEVAVSREDYSKCLTDLFSRFDEKNRLKYIDTINEAITTGKESYCDLVSIPFYEGDFERWTRTRVRMLARNENRHILYIVVEDISEKVRLAERLTDILNNIPVGVEDFKLEDGILVMTYHNDLAAAMFGFKPQEYSDRFMQDPFSCVHEDERQELMEAMLHTYESGRDALETVYRHICADGSYRETQIKAHILRRSGSVTYISAIITGV